MKFCLVSEPFDLDQCGKHIPLVTGIVFKGDYMALKQFSKSHNDRIGRSRICRGCGNGTLSNDEQDGLTFADRPLLMLS